MWSWFASQGNGIVDHNDGLSNVDRCIPATECFFLTLFPPTNDALLPAIILIALDANSYLRLQLTTVSKLDIYRFHQSVNCLQFLSWFACFTLWSGPGGSRWTMNTTRYTATHFFASNGIEHTCFSFPVISSRIPIVNIFNYCIIHSVDTSYSFKRIYRRLYLFFLIIPLHTRFYFDFTTIYSIIISTTFVTISQWSEENIRQ